MNETHSLNTDVNTFRSYESSLEPIVQRGENIAIELDPDSSYLCVVDIGEYLDPSVEAELKNRFERAMEKLAPNTQVVLTPCYCGVSVYQFKPAGHTRAAIKSTDD